MADITNPVFTDPVAARRHLETLRWETTGRFCPHCGVVGKSSPVASQAHGDGFYYCLACRKTFTVTVGTIFERSHVPLNKWLFAFHMMSASKKGCSAHQLHRMIGVTYKTAWFMAHRIRECMRDGMPSPLGGNGKAIEVDETYVGPTTYRTERDARGRVSVISNKGFKDKHIVVTLVERGGRSRSIKVERLNREEMATIIRQAGLGSEHR